MIVNGLDELAAAVGSDLGTTGWLDVDEARVEQFVAAAGDPTFFAVALTNFFMPEFLEVRGVSMGVNYGTDTVILGEPVKAGARVRASALLAACEPVKGGLQATIRVVVVVEGRDEPACVVEALSRYVA